ncbi:MAG: hypothetical protein E7411_06190 [Ruminococcaceae bacterium]|nr:hypothetical protein [Oscillospiraceae bacterium]
MSLIIKIIGVCTIAVFLSLLIKKNHPEYSLAITMCAASVVFAFLFTALKTALDSVNELMVLSGLDTGYVSLILKIMGIAYLSEYISALFYDAGESAMGKKVELSGKVIILVISLPVIKRLTELILTVN